MCLFGGERNESETYTCSYFHASSFCYNDFLDESLAGVFSLVAPFVNDLTIILNQITWIRRNREVTRYFFPSSFYTISLWKCLCKFLQFLEYAPFWSLFFLPLKLFLSRVETIYFVIERNGQYYYFLVRWHNFDPVWMQRLIRSNSFVTLIAFLFSNFQFVITTYYLLCLTFLLLHDLKTFCVWRVFIFSWGLFF